MKIGALLRFGVVYAVLLVLDWVLPGFRATGLALVFMALMLSLLSWGVEWLGGSELSARAFGVLGWASAIVIFYLAHLAIPGIKVSVVAAFIAGSLLWLVSRIFPRVFG